MMYVSDVLRDIPDGLPLSASVELHPAILQVLDRYNALIKEQNGPLEISLEATGLFLKGAISNLAQDDQIQILHVYPQRSEGPSSTFPQLESPKEREDRALKHWMIKATFVTGVVILMGIFGIGGYSVIFNDVSVGDAFGSSQWGVLADIYKLLASM